jgi:haloalkane dehalogenase
MNDETQISADFPFESRYIEVHGSQLHYIDEGTGDPILFLHGNPTSAYLWRNIIPHLTDKGRCIALDLIGMGKSDKPDIGYRFFDHVRYVEGFIEKLELKNITLVIHDWGSGLGFHYAMRHEDNIKGLAFMEAIVRPLRWAGMPAAGKILFRLMRTPVVGWLMISVMNMFVNQVIPQSVVRPLTGEEMSHYRAPYPTASSRKPVRQWPREVPFDGQPADVHEAVSSYSRKLQESDLPKILFYADQGFLINPATLAWCQENFKNLKTVDIGSGRHYVQEDNPHLIGSELAAWYSDL